MKLRRSWSIVVLVLVLGGIVLYLSSQPELLAALRNVSLEAILWLVILRLLFLGTNGLFLRESAFSFRVRLMPREWFGLSVVTAMGNYIAPFSGGMIARAAYLKRRHSFPYAEFVALLASNYLVNFWVIGVVGIAALSTLGTALWFYWRVLVFFATVVLSLL